MQKIIAKWWVIIVLALLIGMLGYGLKQMYFHQDDLDWFILANQGQWGFLTYPLGDHVNYVWRVLLKTEWALIGFNFAPYLMVSVLMHGLVVWLIYQIAWATSGRRELASYAALLFAINTNWTETVLWISGQTITITALFTLLAILSIWQKKNQGIALFLASWTSALSLGMITAVGVLHRDLRMKVLLIGIVLGALYFWAGGDGTAIEWSGQWGVQVASVASLMMINSVIGRLLIPFDMMETGRIVVVSLLVVYGLWRYKHKLREIWSDQWSRFLIVQLGLYNLIVAAGRAQYGVGIMRAERYTYLGLALLLLLIARAARNWQVGRGAWLVPIIIVIQIAGFYQRAEVYVERPQQLRQLVSDMREGKQGVIDPQAYLPHFVFNDERLRYRELIDLMKD